MKASIKNRWVKALRSGKFQQTSAALHRSASDMGNGRPGYCCLGVLRCISGGAIRKDRDGDELLEPATCGISRVDQEELASLNDLGYSFADIANVIESKL